MPKPVTFEAEVGKDEIKSEGQYNGTLGRDLELVEDEEADGLKQWLGEGLVHLAPAHCEIGAAILGACQLRPGKKCRVRVTVERI